MTSVRGICRFRIEQLAPDVRLYVTPINLDPERPALPISHPLYYSIYLAKLHDSFATLGLAEDTWALNTGAIGEDAFLEQTYAIHAEREAMFFEALRRTKRGLCACVFDASDRIQHMFYRFTTPDHPCRPGPDETRHATVIDDMYERMDALVGRVQKAIDAKTLLLVLSDHGFCDFSCGVHLNAWLRDEGYLVLEQGAAGGEYLAGVDWSRTRAYAFGLAGIYINQKGREARGIVNSGADKNSRPCRTPNVVAGRRSVKCTRPARRTPVPTSKTVLIWSWDTNLVIVQVGKRRWDAATDRSFPTMCGAGAATTASIRRLSRECCSVIGS